MPANPVTCCTFTDSPAFCAKLGGTKATNAASDTIDRTFFIPATI
jgi:hypothetical protein